MGPVDAPPPSVLADAAEPVAEQPAAAEPVAAVASVAEELAQASPPEPLCGKKQGTYAGYAVHAAAHEPPCDPCRDAKRKYQKDLRQRKAAEQDHGQSFPDPRPEPAGAVEVSSEDGLSRAIQMLGPPGPVLTDEQAAELAGKVRRAAAPKPVERPRSDRPDGAVAFLSLPMTVPAFVAVADSLELAYGPGLRLEGRVDGMWISRGGVDDARPVG